LVDLQYIWGFKTGLDEINMPLSKTISF